MTTLIQTHPHVSLCFLDESALEFCIYHALASRFRHGGHRCESVWIPLSAVLTPPPIPETESSIFNTTN